MNGERRPRERALQRRRDAPRRCPWRRIINVAEITRARVGGGRERRACNSSRRPVFPTTRCSTAAAGASSSASDAIVVDRPEPQALWTPRAPEREWQQAHAVFAGDDDEDKGRWRIDKPVPESWPVKVGAATMLCRLASFRHMGLFPEQMPHWEWMLAASAEKRARAAARVEPLCLHRRCLADRRCCRRSGHSRRRFEEGHHLGEGEPGGVGAGVGADPLDAR